MMDIYWNQENVVKYMVYRRLKGRQPLIIYATMTLDGPMSDPESVLHLTISEHFNSSISSSANILQVHCVRTEH